MVKQNKTKFIRTYKFITWTENFLAVRLVSSGCLNNLRGYMWLALPLCRCIYCLLTASISLFRVFSYKSHIGDLPHKWLLISSFHDDPNAIETLSLYCKCLYCKDAMIKFISLELLNQPRNPKKLQKIYYFPKYLNYCESTCESCRYS